MLSAKTNQRECPRHLTSPSLCSARTAFILIGIVCVFVCFVLCVCVCVCVATQDEGRADCRARAVDGKRRYLQNDRRGVGDETATFLVS